ncbi:F0F1 ATP synthase subunit A [Spiroplasma endosymbiont of Polydrusus pterygomalis]|uniref:F0F1 ATP synthase subunit A n=1 Tax=Spiroplasma endosymbiont of Polydrusus pterygomalis TaxID=3139327 RepID=UPI003CCAB48E
MNSLVGLESWNYLKIMPQLITILITTVFISVISYIYYYKVKRMKADEDPRGIVLVVELIIKAVEKIVVDVLGIKYKNLTIYLLYVMGYILIGNWLSIIGLEPQASSYTVTLSMALVTFIGIYYIAIKFQKFLFLKKFIINPLELITQFAPLISLSFRLFGNILGGSIILAMLYGVTGEIWSNIPIIGQVNLLIGVIGPFLHIYFDLFTGSIQALIFGTLTLVYWKLQMDEGSPKAELTIKLPRKLRKQGKHHSNHEEEIYNDRLIMEQK